jgi:hypothetical protein
MTTPSGRFAHGSTPGPESDTSRSVWRTRGYDLQLTRYDERGWRATFYTTGMEHSPTRATGTGWEPTPWHATQRAAWGALQRVDQTAATSANNASQSARLTSASP